jgi:hypothetical protein
VNGHLIGRIRVLARVLFKRRVETIGELVAVVVSLALELRDEPEVGDVDDEAEVLTCRREVPVLPRPEADELARLFRKRDDRPVAKRSISPELPPREVLDILVPRFGTAFERLGIRV